MTFSASWGLPVMLTDPSESLDASPKMSTFKTWALAGGADSIENRGDPDLVLMESTGIGAGTDPAEGLALLDDPRRRNEDRDTDKTARVSSSEESSDSVSESDGTLAGSFCSCLLLGWDADRFPPAVP